MPFEYNDLKKLAATLSPDAGLSSAFARLMMYDSVLEAHDVSREGVIHLGAHAGQEVMFYLELGFRRALMIEPQAEEFARLADRCHSLETFLQAGRTWIGEPIRPRIEFQCVRCAASDRSGVAKFYRTPQTAKSSLLKPTPEADPDQDTESTCAQIEVETRPLDDIVQSLDHGWDAGDFTYLRMNIQGGELLALKGAENVIKGLQAIALEVSLDSRYDGQPTKEEFDDFLGARGFTCVFGWRYKDVGNLLYRRA